MTQAADAGARFDAIMAVFKDAWAEEYPSQPFEVDGVVTPKAMRFIAGYEAGLRARAVDRIDAALAAEPASGEADKLDERVLCVTCGKPAVGQCICAPPPPPTQGEEDTALEIVRKVMHAEFKDHSPEGPDEPTQLKDAIAAALRQRADEATEACAKMVWDEAFRFQKGSSDWVATMRLHSAIRARIAPPT